MTERYYSLLKEVQTLNRQEQLSLIAALSLNLVEEEVSTDDQDFFLPPEDDLALQKRIAAYEKGEKKGRPYKEAMSDIRQRLGIS